MKGEVNEGVKEGLEMGNEKVGEKETGKGG